MMVQVQTSQIEALINQVLDTQTALGLCSDYDETHNDFDSAGRKAQNEARQSILNTSDCVLVGNTDVESISRGRIFIVETAVQFFCEKRQASFGDLYQKVFGKEPTLSELRTAYNSIEPSSLSTKAMRSRAKSFPQTLETVILNDFARHRNALNMAKLNSWSLPDAVRK